MPATREYSLDFLKVFATLLIILHHYQHMFMGEYTFIQYFGGRFYFGYLVEMFFLLSGYFSCHMINEIINGSGYFSGFILKRGVRLLPLMAIAAVVDQLLQFVGSGFDFSRLSLWGTFISSLGLQSIGIFEDPGINGPMWYISVLLLCYVLFYFVTWLSKKLLVSRFWLYAIMIFIGVTGISSDADFPFLNSYTSRGYAAFFSGLCLGLLFEKAGDQKKTVWYFLAVCFLIFFVLCYFCAGEIVDEDIQFILLFMVYPAILLLFKSPAALKLFSHRIWGIMGKISFDVYVWHLNIIRVFLILAALMPTLPVYSRIGMLFFVLTCAVVGILSYYLIEKPISRCLKNKLLGNKPTDSVV